MQRNYKTKLEVTICKATQRLKWYCDPKKIGSATINTNKVPFNKNVKKQTVINKSDVSDINSMECTETGWIYHDT